MFHIKIKSLSDNIKYFSTTITRWKSHNCKVLVVGGGSGGCPMAARFARKLPKNAVIVLEPDDRHYYQPLFTLIGGGVKSTFDSWKYMLSVLPENALWLQDAAEAFVPDKSAVITRNGDVVNYDYMVVAVGLKYDYEKIPGLSEALQMPDSDVSTIYGCDLAKRWSMIANSAVRGEALFTMPQGPIKCGGAPQKICYLADSLFRYKCLRPKFNITYNSALPDLFVVPEYAKALWEVMDKKEITVNLNTELVSIDPEKKEALFKKVSPSGRSEPSAQLERFPYCILHTVPPMSPPECLKCSPLVDTSGYLDVDVNTLQHISFTNVFGIGDCTNVPTSKTTAAITAQSHVLSNNLKAVMKGKRPKWCYCGYSACPLITSYQTCIMAEFDYSLKPKPSFLVNQAVERQSMYYMQADVLPKIYWNLMVPGHWNGPAAIRQGGFPLTR